MRWFLFLASILALIVGGSAIAPAVSAQTVIQNGSFEDASVNPGAGFSRLPLGDTRVTGWITTGVSTDYIGTYWEASDGIRSFDLDGASGTTSGVAQTFATTPGKTYHVKFDMSGNPDNVPIIKPMRVSADGQNADFTFDVTGRSHPNMGWSPRSWEFVADDTSATLEFRSLTTPAIGQGWGPAIDNVKVTEAPPVPALGVIGQGVAVVLLMTVALMVGRRRRLVVREIAR